MKYPFMLFIIAPIEMAQAISDQVQSLIPDIGPNNVDTPLIPLNGLDDAEPTHACFLKPVRQSDIDTLFNQGLGTTPGLIWARTDRAGNLQKTNESEEPTPRKLTASTFLEENGLRIKRTTLAIV